MRDSYWWTTDLVPYRDSAAIARRKLSHAYRRVNVTVEEVAALQKIYNDRKRAFKTNIRRAKIVAWENFCETINGDPRGKPYKVIVKALKGYRGQATLPDDVARGVVADLFVTQAVEPPRLPLDAEAIHIEEIPQPTGGDVLGAAKKINHRKAPGLDQMPLCVLTELMRMLPQSALRVSNACWEHRCFPEIWITQKLIFLPKGEVEENSVQKYRPISLIPKAAKVIEHTVKTRLIAAWNAAGGFAEHQYGFRKGRSTVDALMTVRRFAQKAKAGNLIACMIMVDVKNVFNNGKMG